MDSQSDMAGLMTCKFILYSQQSPLEHHHPERTHTVWPLVLQLPVLLASCLYKKLMYISQVK
jgi:hypothetical protein